MSIPIRLFTATHCEDSKRTRAHLQALGRPFVEVNIDHDADAEIFLKTANGGARSTPVVIIGEGHRRWLLTEPTDAELDEVLTAASA